MLLRGNSAGPDGLMKLQFRDVPEEQPADLERLVKRVYARRRQRQPSYGAFILRGVGEQGINDWTALVSRQEVERSELRRSPFNKRSGEDTEVHIDNGIRNDMTAHLTHIGSIEAIVLPGAKLIMGGADRKVATNHLFEDGQLDTKALTVPTTAYKTTLHDNDLLIFDHTQPHAFLTNSDERFADAYYFMNPVMVVS
jgi:hypothetical protein